MIYVKIGETLYPATINGLNNDHSWDGRKSKTIHLEMSHAEAEKLFVDGQPWSIIMDTVKEVEQPQEDGTVEIVEVPAQEEYDNSDFSVAGDITDHRDGTLSVKMGKPTQIEQLEEENAALLFENLTGEVL